MAGLEPHAAKRLDLSPEVRRLLNEALAWDREADRLARQNPVGLRAPIRSCQRRAREFRAQARLEEQIQNERRTAA